MATWARDPATGYTLFGSGRTALIAERDFPTDAALRLQLARPNAGHLVFALVLASKDGRSGYEIGVNGANIEIRSVLFGDPASVHVWQSAAHGLDVTRPYFLEIRFTDGKIEARLNGASNAVVSHTPGDSASPTFTGYRHFGFVSNVNGALVRTAQLCDLVNQVVNRADLLFAACGADGFLIEGQNVRLVQAGMFNSSGDVAAVEFEQKIYAVDGSHAWIIDPVTFAVSKWTPTAGALPGATPDPNNPGQFLPGTTTATMICVYRGRIWLAGMPEDPQNLFASAVNDPLDWDTGSGEPGGAFGLTAAEIGKVGQPITCIVRSTRNSIIIGCNNSIWELRGDPSGGPPEVFELLSKAGISGKDAVTTVAQGRLVVHTTAGVYVLGELGAPYALSSAVLTDGIQIPREDIEDYIVQVRRDPQRSQVYFFLTKRVPSGTSLHFAYNEKVGGDPNGNGEFIPAAGGWEPDYFAERFGPTASTPEPYQGHVVWGTRNGYLMVLDDTLTEDDGEPVNVEVPVSLMDEVKIARETILHKFNILPAEGATVKYRVYGGLTPQKAYGNVAGRHVMLSGTASGRRQDVSRKVRYPALVLSLYNDDGTPFGVEDVDAVTTTGRIVSQRDYTAAAAPGAPCAPPFFPLTSTAAVPSSFDTGPGNTGTAFSIHEGTHYTGTIGDISSFSSDPPEPTDTPVGYTFHSHQHVVSGAIDTDVSLGGCTVVVDLINQHQHTLCGTGQPHTLANGGNQE